MLSRQTRMALSAILALELTALGCSVTPRQYWEALKGDGFPQWSEKIGKGVSRDGQGAQPSGFFTDRRSEQIEQNLGGGF
jgi:hypothetical protein